MQLSQKFQDEVVPTHFLGTEAVLFIPYEWPGRADDRSLYTESTQQAMLIEGLLTPISQ